MVALVAPVMAANETFPADADSYVRFGTSFENRNYGTATSLSTLQTSLGVHLRSLIHFDLSSIPKGAEIESATLYAYMSARAGDREVGAYRVTDTWNESGVTWKTQPSVDTQPTSSIDPGSAVNTWICWNVTQDVQAYADGTANYGWMIKNTDESTPSMDQKVTLRSRNYADATQHPYLNVTYTIPPLVLTTIEVSPATASVAVNATQQFNATAKDQNGDEMTNVCFTWRSSNETVGTVNTSGYFTALAAGTTTITASAENVSGAATVTASVPTCDLTFAGGGAYPITNAVFTRMQNTIRVGRITNLGSNMSPETEVEVRSSDGFVGRATLPPVQPGEKAPYVFLIDTTIRESEGGKVTYTTIIDPDNTVVEISETNNAKTTPPQQVGYNGYLGKRYMDSGNDLTTVRTYDLRGDIINSFGDSHYISGKGKWTNYTVNWTGDDLLLPEGATVRDAWLYVPYCWDSTNVAPNNLSITFNGDPVPYVNWYHDKANFGTYGGMVYGLMTYNVTTSYKVGVNNTALFEREKAGTTICPAGFTLAVVYEDPSVTRKQIFVNEEFDALGADSVNYGTNESRATAYAPFSGMTLDTANVSRANLTTFVPWGNSGEGNLYFNGNRIGSGVWNYGPLTVGGSDSPQVAVDDREVTAYLNATGNEATIQSSESSQPLMVAAQTFLVIEYADPAAPDLTVSTLMPNKNEIFSATGNTYTAKITNIGTADAGAFSVEFKVSGVTGAVAVPDGLAAGANTTLTWTDSTVHAAGEPATFTVTADPGCMIDESNEENNVRSFEKTVVDNGYRGKRWTGGEDLTTAVTYDVRGDLAYSSGDSLYLGAADNPHWTAYTANWTVNDLDIPADATVTAARLYVPYTWDKGPVFPGNVTLTFNDIPVERAAFYSDEKMWGSSYPYGMTVYDVTEPFSTDGNAAVLTNIYPGGGNVSVRGMVLAAVYDDGVTAPHTIVINEGFDLLYGGSGQATTPEQATAYAPFTLDTTNAVNATLVALAPGAGPNEGELIFNDNVWTDAWNFTGQSQIGAAERDVTSLLAGEGNVAAFQSSGDWMEAAAAFLVVTNPVPNGCIEVTSTPEGAAIFLDGEDTSKATNTVLEDIPAGEHVVTLKLENYADASTPVTVVEGETATVDLSLTTLTGSLAVTSTPDGASIFIDGADTGETTDTTLTGIAVGDHTLALKKEGYREAFAEVTIRHDETTDLHLDLEKAVGCIAVTSTPEGAAIFLDGEETGETTNAILEGIAVGEHTITLKKSGYMEASATVTVIDTETASVEFTLAEPAGNIVVTSSPDGARVFLDGKDTGEQTNTTLTRVSPGEHQVAVSLEGYLEAEKAVTVVEGESVAVHFDLSQASITLLPGWNFVSTPKTLAPGHDTIAIFDEVDTADHSVLLYNGTKQWEAMSSEEAFRPLDGIWIYANGTYEIPLAFDTGGASAPPEKALDEGWNAIGFTDTVPEPAANTLRSVEKCWATLIGFDAGAQEYKTSIIRGADGRHGEMRAMEPMDGYWLYMSDADLLCAIGA
ncbi:DUF3344 domain-containing protein [Methanofollis formosanus]|nr:DUF3344 domain-containing protein [Methanofollis formosanus]